MELDTILWRRLDTPGHDACRLVEQDGAWGIHGAAAFRHESGAAALVYTVECDREWRTRQGVVNGWIGSRGVDLRITRNPAGVWTLNGRIMPDFEECVNLDFGFTPATNLPQLRRVALAVGQSADVPVAWLDVLTGAPEVLHQRYERRTADTYWYEAPRFGYAALLHVRAPGFVEKYPSLWEAEAF